MPTAPPTRQQLRTDNEDLRVRLERAEETLREILSGEGDALFVKGGGGAQLYALEGADHSYRTLIENMSEGALTLTAEGVIVYANRRFAEMLGTPLEKVIGSGIHAWFAPDDHPVLQALLRKDAIGNRPQELALAAADGTRVPVYLSVNRRLLDGVPESLCMVATDLTEQKRNEAILAEEKLARAILEQSADAIVICDATGRIIRASQRAQAFFDQNLLGQRFERAFPLRQSDGTPLSPVGAIDTISGYSVEARLEHEGKEFCFLVSVGHLKGAGSEPLGCVVTLTEITARKQAAQALLETTQRLDGIVTSALDAIVTMDEEERIVLSNPAAERMFGYTAAELKGRPLDLLLPERFRAAHSAHVAAFGMAGVTSRKMVGLRPVSGLRKSGEEFPIEASISKEESTGRKFFTAFLRDITERARSDERIRRLNRVYAVLGSIDGLIVRVRERDELFKEACRIAVEAGAFRMAWIGVIDPQTRDGRVVAWHGGEEGYVAKIRLTAREGTPDSDRPACRALRQSQPVISNDLLADTTVLPLRAELSRRGHRSAGCFPLTVDGRTEAVIVLLAGEVGFFDEDEMRLLLTLAGNISFALNHIEKRERLDFLAYYDELTGLANRKLFLDRAQQKVLTAGRIGRKAAIVVLDVERFRSINDVLGRHVGDELLRQIAGRMTRESGDDTRLARNGADQFGIVVAEAESEQQLARLFEQRLREVFGSPFSIAGTEVQVSAKLGIAVFPADGADAVVLLSNAEAALRKAKSTGERYVFYTQQMTERVAETLSLETKLRQALEKDEFVLHYQPKADLETRGIVGMEALIRWQSPDRGLVPPMQFIPLLEETGLILPVGAWALRRAALEHRAWAEAGLQPPRVAVNVSAIQLHQRDFVHRVEQAIKAGTSPAGIDLEITESLIMQDVGATIVKLKELRALGLRVAIDDFGTGYSSLAYLAQLPVETLKIDRSFVIRMLDDANTLSVVQAMISLAHALRLKVVAEGVETEEQAKMLHLLRCDQMQGYLFSKPLPLEEMTALLRSHAVPALAVAT